MLKILLLISLLPITIIISQSKSNMIESKTYFTWNIQLGGYDYEKYDDKGVINYQAYIKEFEKFPWIEQLEISNKLQKGCYPTLSVIDNESGKILWISIIGDKNEHAYLLGYNYRKTVKTLFGLGKTVEKKWMDIYIAENKSIVINRYREFFNRNFSNLETELKNLELYDSMEPVK